MDNENVEKMNGYTIRIFQEEYVNDPRAEWDHAAKMFAKHPHYNLGDKRGDSEIEFVEGEHGEIWRLPKGTEVKTLYLLDHSGLWMSTGRFNCDPGGWDTSRIGIIYMTPNMMRAEFLKKRPSKKTLQLARELMESEVNEYNQYLTGDVWYYEILDSAGEFVDGCGGMYGYDYCLESAREIVKGLPFQLTLPLEDGEDE